MNDPLVSLDIMIKYALKIYKLIILLILLILLFSVGFFTYQKIEAQALSTLSVSTIPLCNITRDLKFGMVSPDIKDLQKYLNNNGFTLAQTGFGSKGQETNFFGTLTKNALVRFQKDNKIPATIGVFDLATRDFLGCGREGGMGSNLSYILTYTTKTGGTIYGAINQTVISGGNGTPVTAMPNSGYYFTNWSDGSTINPRTDINVTVNKSIVANFVRRHHSGGGGSSSTPTEYTVTYDANGSTDGTKPDDQTKTYDVTLVLASNSGTLIKTGHAFAGWNTLANGTGTDYAEGANYTANTGVTLYAKWTLLVFACGDDVSFTYNGSPVTYGTVTNSTTGECWLDRNLGATRVALSSTDSAAYGDLFQWGRPADGHQLINRTTEIPVNGTQSGQVATITPETNTFIIPNSDWSSVDSNGALRSAYFAKTDGTGICPTDFRVPTETEINTERLSWSSLNSTGAFASPLKLTMVGYRYYTTGTLGGVDGYGVYWSSTVNSTLSRNLTFSGGSADMFNNDRGIGLAVRCIKD